jgi:hypothetical protein
MDGVSLSAVLTLTGCSFEFGMTCMEARRFVIRESCSVMDNKARAFWHEVHLGCSFAIVRSYYISSILRFRH